jgi:DNA primase
MARLPDSFLEELRARVPMTSLVGRRVKLARSGRHWKGCCPFHAEKTPSFYVYEDGYHCFGCGAHGDAIGFVMQSSGGGFMEAVEQLAAEAGLEVPKPTPQAAEEDRRRLDLHAVLDQAAILYQHNLFAAQGTAALTYLRGRGLTDDTIRQFGLGFAPDGHGLARRMSDIATPAQLLEAGLLRASEDGAPGREQFYNRVMFPIRDGRGRVISFGGRILGDGQPKYVNGPETVLFSKRRTLYGLDLARQAVRNRAELVAVEGYMDVIALHQAGFAGAVAPLGTALTDEQLEALWRLAPAPPGQSPSLQFRPRGRADNRPPAAPAARRTGGGRGTDAHPDRHRAAPPEPAAEAGGQACIAAAAGPRAAAAGSHAHARRRRYGRQPGRRKLP